MLLAVANEVYSTDYTGVLEKDLSKYVNNIQRQYKALYKIIQQIINLKPKPKWNLKIIHRKYKTEKIQFKDDSPKDQLLQMLSTFQETQITRLDKLFMIMVQTVCQTDNDYKKMNSQLVVDKVGSAMQKKQNNSKTVDSSTSRLQQVNLWKKDYEK